MKKLCRASILDVLKRAKSKYFANPDALYSGLPALQFSYRDHIVVAKFAWSESRLAWYVSSFQVVYSNCVMEYIVRYDYDMDSALCW